jgi:flagellar motor switch protein FliM
LNKLLSQDEVDALLKGLDTGDIEVEQEPEENETEYESFDWASQGRNINVSMPLLGVVSSRFSQKLRGSLSSSLRKMVDVTAGTLEMVRFNEFQRSLPIPTSLHLFKLEPLRGTGILVIESHLVFNLVEAFFGGSSSGATKVEGRDFTPIEKKIIEKVVHMALMNLMESWEDVHPIKTEFVRSESNPLVVNVARPEEYLVYVKFEIEINRSLGNVIICIPYSSFQPIRHKLAGGYRSEDTTLDQYWVNTLKSHLMETHVQMKVDLGRASLSIKDLLNMRVGDIIILENGFKSPLLAHVEGIPKFEGYAGRFKNTAVFRIEQPIVNKGKKSEAATDPLAAHG